MGAEEFLEWWEYYQIEPFGEEVEWLRFGRLAAVIAQCAGNKGYQPRHFIPDFRKAAKPKTAAEMIAEFDHMFALHNQYEESRK